MTIMIQFIVNIFISSTAAAATTSVINRQAVVGRNTVEFTLHKPISASSTAHNAFTVCRSLLEAVLVRGVAHFLVGV